MLNKDGAETKTTVTIIEDQPQDNDDADSKPKISFILTMFNIVCHALIPSTILAIN